MNLLRPNRATATAVMTAAVALASQAQKQSEQAQKPLNIVYIMTDDHTAQMMSCYDKRYINTPNLDRIAENGLRFVNSYVANSLSGPSRACMLTGKHSHANGYTANEFSRFDGNQQTFPKLLQKAGYQTAIFGKWHLGAYPQGFDKWEIVPGQGDYYNPHFITMQGDTVQNHGYITTIITDKSLNWLENTRDKSKPFCLLIHHKAVHRIWMSDTCDLNEFEDKVYPMPANFWDDYKNRPAAAAQEMSIDKDMDLIYDLKMYHPEVQTRLKWGYVSQVNRMDSAQRAAWDAFYDPIRKDFYSRNLKGKELVEWKFQRYVKDYMKAVKSLDDNVGRVLKYLDESGLSENTLVVYTSDQGFYIGEHGWFDKRFMYEESFRTPLVMMLPKGYERRGDVTEMVQNIDYAPTFLDIAGVEVPSDIHGVSMLPLIKGEKPKNWRKSLYYHFHEYPAEHAVKRHYGVTDGRYKLIHFYNDIDVWELYDLKKDPMEMNNIFGQKGTEKIAAKMFKELKKLQEQYDDPVRFEYTTLPK